MQVLSSYIFSREEAGYQGNGNEGYCGGPEQEFYDSAADDYHDPHDYYGPDPYQEEYSEFGGDRTSNYYGDIVDDKIDPYMETAVYNNNSYDDYQTPTNRYGGVDDTIQSPQIYRPTEVKITVLGLKT